MKIETPKPPRGYRIITKGVVHSRDRVWSTSSRAWHWPYDFSLGMKVEYLKHVARKIKRP